MGDIDGTNRRLCPRNKERFGHISWRWRADTGLRSIDRQAAGEGGTNRLHGLMESNSIVVEQAVDIRLSVLPSALSAREVAHHGRDAVMAGHGHRLGQRHVLSAGS